ncbi:MAG TPA: hypothetical protein VFN67_17305 [Polyangiales bacterium]|nr:hypothetical protein [Polyangiales bacterium]
MKPRIMYIEDKSSGLTGHARIGLVSFSKTGRTLYYKGRAFQSLRGRGFKANYIDLETQEKFWFSGPHRDGCDTLYPGLVEIDDDVREAYWRDIRGKLDALDDTNFRSPGAKRD